MLEVLGAIGLLAFAVSSISVGIRCTVRGAQTRALPELSVGIGFLVGVLVGYLPESLATSTDLFSPEVSRRILAVTQIAIRIAAAAVMVFTVSVFRRHDRWSWALFGALLLALVASWVAFPHYASYATNARDLFWYEVFSVARASAAAWGAAESLVYYRMARSRSQLGLADPLVANRFLLWGIGLASLACLMASTTLARFAGADPTAITWVLLESSMGLVGAVTLWLAFFPTRRYRERIQQRATA